MTHQLTLDDAARSVTAKLQAFRDNLTDDERTALSNALYSTGALTDGDVSGHLLPGLGPVITANIAQQAQAAVLVQKVLDLFGVTPPPAPK